MARMLLERGADPNAKNRFGGVALAYCVRQGSIEFIKLLFEFEVGLFYGCLQLGNLLQKYHS